MRTATPSLVNKHLRQIPSWFWWLAPKPFDWVATALYIGVFIAFIAAHWVRWTISWQAVILAGILLLLLSITFCVLFVVTMARVVSRERASRMRAEQLLTEVESSHRQLKAYAEQVAELAATEERNRVARDIHDSLGHALMAITVQLEKALVYYERQPHEAVQAVSDAKGVAKEALQDVRRSLRVLRTTQGAFSCAEGVTHLTQRLRSTHLAIDLRIIGNEEGFSRQALMTLYRVAQEGLTNIQKHSHASAAQVEVYFGQQEARLSIRDNGCGFDPRFVRQEPGDGEEGEGGYGLQGIREHLDLVGGSLHLESHPGHGTRLVITVPKVSVSVWQKETSEG